MKKLLLMALLSGPVVGLANQFQSISTPLPTSNFQGGVSYFGYYSSEVQDIKIGNAGIYSYHLLAFNYKHNPRFTLSLRPTFTHESAGVRYGESLPAKTQMSDSHVAIVDKKPFELPWSLNSKITYKVYFPTDPEWQKAGTQGALGADLDFSRDLSSGYAIGYYPKGFVLIQGQNTYISNNSGTGKIKPTQSAQLEQWIRLTKYFGDRFSLSQGIGLKNFYFNAETTSQARQTQHPLLETSLNITVTDDIDVSIGLGQQNNPNERSWQVYNDIETSYIVMTSIRI